MRAIVELVAGQAAVIRRDIDRLWDDQQTALADDWAIPYIGDLLGTLPVSELNRRGQRVSVARTIFYRRRKGTLPVLEALIRDIADLDGIVVEAFRRLGRTRHRLDPEIVGLEGLVTRTTPGGTADLRSPRVSDVVDGPFDDLAHMLDVRRRRGPYGRYNISKINFHLCRLQAFAMPLATTFDLGDNRFTLDPSGRDIDLFQPRQRPDEGEPWRPIHEWEAPASLTCRRLNAARFNLSSNEIPTSLADELAPYAGFEYRTESAFRRMLDDRLTPAQQIVHRPMLLEEALTQLSPKVHLWPGAISLTIADNAGAAPLLRHEALGADLATWATAVTVEPDRRALIDPARGRVQLTAAPPTGQAPFAQRYHFGLANPVGAGPFDRAAMLSDNDDVTGTLPTGPINGEGFFTDPGPIDSVILPTSGVQRVPTSKTYIPDLEAGQTWAGVGPLTLEAADGERPFFRFEPPAADPTVTITAATGGDPPDLVIDGLWLSIQPPDLAVVSLADPGDPAPVVPARIVIDGDWRNVVLRHCTIDPGGERARVTPLSSLPIPTITLEVRGQIELLLIDRCITGPILEATSSGDACSAREIVIQDSIVQSLDPAVPAISSRIASVELRRSTVFGDVTVDRLYATDALIRGLVRVTDTQHGCFRFSAADADPNRRLPPQFESHLLAPTIPNHFFTSRRFGDSGFAQLGPTAPMDILQGGENRSEIGVFNRRLIAIRLADLDNKITEFLPFGLIAQPITET
ncbi:hypothetical protein Q4F19_17195 [Sphingomonas sp. BIUV-7]|uniref:Uncharacterized protein n=1 Tax=Sphingomonas natans TaxID=3063330 RepID=A0ABT8YCR9_9SPHN|nr:hypothetical protein [Sphingomonas sp. BIUV-7]MDO6416125.1 hypothetical protein [Sphingomonas sp. BIUV-7]